MADVLNVLQIHGFKEWEILSMVVRDKEDYPVNSDKNQHQISQFILEPVMLTELDSLYV